MAVMGFGLAQALGGGALGGDSAKVIVGIEGVSRTGSVGIRRGMLRLLHNSAAVELGGDVVGRRGIGEDPDAVGGRDVGDEGDPVQEVGAAIQGKAVPGGNAPKVRRRRPLLRAAPLKEGADRFPAACLMIPDPLPPPSPQTSTMIRLGEHLTG